jgi:hypothetical protein
MLVIAGFLVALGMSQRPDGLGLDAESEIAAYRTAISKCPGHAVIVLPPNTPDAVFLPIRRRAPGATRQDPSHGVSWGISISMDRLGEGFRSGVLEIFKRSGDNFGTTTRLPFRLIGNHGHIQCKVLSTVPLPVSAEKDLLIDAAGRESRLVFVDSPPKVIVALKKKGIRAVPNSTFKKDADYVATGFIRIDRPFVRWFAKNHALVTLATCFRPKGGDVTYSSGGPYELRWIKGKLNLKCLTDQWAGE